MNRRDDLDSGVRQPALVWQQAGGSDVTFTIWFERAVSIGRDPSSAVALESTFVSKHHATLQYTGGDFVLEDLRSANGTRVNGVPVMTATVVPGDVIEIGDQRLLFVDRADEVADVPVARPDPGKAVRLAATAFATLVVGGGLLLLLVGSGPEAQPTASAKSEPVASPPRASAMTAVHPTEAEAAEVGRIEQLAQQTGVWVVDSLFDEAVQQYRGGRVRLAAVLWAAVLARKPDHAVASARLREALAALEVAITDQVAQANRAMAQLRYRDAAISWEQVLLMTNDDDPRHAEALSEIAHTREPRR